IIENNFGRAPDLTVEHAPSRFYGDKFGNMAGFGIISILPFYESTSQHGSQTNSFSPSKVLSVLEALRDYPEDFDLGIVNEPANPRHGMWTTTQPQMIVIITKPPEME
ncbi:MAG TPA: hypothetical protein VE820_09690, partial [Sphingomicrobium sp.]|nr:hypothetical protein [Sphingomicrobium sp.]